MARSFLILILALAAIGLEACSSAEPPPKPAAPPAFVAHSTTLQITNGIKVLTQVMLPSGFAPIASRSPVWLQNSEEIGVVGTQDGHTIMYGLGGAAWRTGRILAAETGPSAAEEGTIMDVAASPEGLTLATAVVPTNHKRLDIIVRDLIATGPGQSIASFDGQFDSVSMSWLNRATIALALRRHPEPPPPPPSATQSEPPADETESGQALVVPPADGLQIVVVTGAGSVAPLKLPPTCTMSPLSWSTHGVYAVAQGDPGVRPMIIDRRNSTCTRFHVPDPIQVLDWATDDEGSFLYAGPDPTRHTVGVYKYNIETGADHLMGASTSAAAFSAGGEVVTLGSQKLTFRNAIEHAQEQFLAQVAIEHPDQGEMDIEPLGFNSLPPMFAQSTMVYSRSADEAAMQIFAPARGQTEPWRMIVTYSMRVDSAFLLAEGPAKGTVTMSWSVKGRWLALLDGEASTSTVLTVLEPPR